MRISADNLSFYSKTTGFIVLGIAMFALVGWLTGLHSLRSISPDYIPMSINTAICLIISVLALRISSYPKKGVYTIVLFACLACLLFFTTANALEYLLNKDLGIDKCYYPPTAKIIEPFPNPGRMAPSTVICFSLIIFSIVGLYCKFSNYIYVQTAALCIFSISYFSLTGYFVGVNSFYGFGINLSYMALTTTIAFLFMSVSILTAHGNRGINLLFTSASSITKASRQLIIIILVLEIMVAYLHLYGEKRNMYGGAFGIGLVSFVNAVVLTIIVLYGVKKLIREDDRRRSAELILEKQAHMLASKNTQLNDFCNIVCHNLRGPLVNISTLVEFIEQGTDENERLDLITQLKPLAANLNEIFNELVESVQVRNDGEIEKDNIDIESAIRKVIDGLHFEIQNTKAKIQVDVKNAPQVRFPAGYFYSIVFNLLSNALKYKSDKRLPEVTITTEASKGVVIMKVSDNGLGIDMRKYKDQVFKIRKVFHHHPNAKGFGLFMTKTQIEAMGGRIWLESEVDKGTTFFIEFNA